MDEGLLTNTEFRSMPLNQTGRKYKEELLPNVGQSGEKWLVVFAETV